MRPKSFTPAALSCHSLRETLPQGCGGGKGGCLPSDCAGFGNRSQGAFGSADARDCSRAQIGLIEPKCEHNPAAENGEAPFVRCRLYVVVLYCSHFFVNEGKEAGTYEPESLQS